MIVGSNPARAIVLFAFLCATPATVNAQILNPLPGGGAPETRAAAPQPAQRQAQQPAAENPQEQPRERVTYAKPHESWAAVCILNEDDERECFAETKVTKRDAPKKPFVRLRFVPAGDSPTGLTMELSVPIGSMLPTPVKLKVGEKVFNAPYTICDQDLCTARVSVPSPLLATLFAAEGSFVTFTAPPSEEITVPLTLKGLSSAILDMSKRIDSKED